MASAKKRILIGEDERPIAKALQLKLSLNKDHEVFVAANGEEVIKMLGESEPDFDLLLLDLVMPVKNGFEVMEAVAKMTGKKPKIIVSSNLSQDEDVQRAKELGAVDYYVKSNTSLVDIIKKVEAHLSAEAE